MVNKFGDDTGGGFGGGGGGSDVQFVKKVTHKHGGTFGNYCRKITSSYQIGFSPYRHQQSKGVTVPVYTYANKVYSHGSMCSGRSYDSFQHSSGDHHGQVCANEIITDHPLSSDDYLVTFKHVDYEDLNDDDDDSSGGDIFALKGESGDVGPRGESGPQGEQGPAGINVDYSKVEILVTRMLPSLFKPTEFIKKLRKEKCECLFKISDKSKDLIFYNSINISSKVWTWKNTSIYSEKKDAQSNDESESDTMATCSSDDEKIKGRRWFLKMDGQDLQQYKINQPLQAKCCIFLVYQLIQRPVHDNIQFILGCSEEDSHSLKHPAIGFDAHAGLNIADGRGAPCRFAHFPRTNPLQTSKWHLLCVEWSPQKRGTLIKTSSIWVNGLKAGTFSSSIQKPSEFFILGGMRLLDRNSEVRADIAHVEVYNDCLEDYKKYLIQLYLCSLYNIKVDVDE